MYRVIIVDDEPLIVAGITSMLPWEDYQCQVVGKAANGQKALLLMEQLNPDIVITDIKMPAMDGIELMRSAREQGYDTAFILLTNLEEFSLAKEAMKLDAVDYLVKLELTQEKLIESLEKAMKSCDLKRQAKGEGAGSSAVGLTDAESAANCFRKLLYETGSIGREQIPAQVRETFTDPVMLLINFDYGYEDFSVEFTRQDQKQMMSYAENIISEMANGFFDTSCLIRREQTSLILVLPVSDCPDYRERIASMGTKMASVIKDYFEVSVSIGVSAKGSEITEFSELLYQAMGAMNRYYYDSSSPILFYSEQCEVSERHNSNFNIGFLKKDLTQAVRQNDSRGFQKIMQQLIELFREYKPAKPQAVNACSNLYYFLSSFYENEEEAGFPYAVNIMGQLNRCKSLDGILRWITWFTQEVTRLLDSRKASKSDTMITLVRQYVEEHYKEKITLGQTAQALNLSQGYLSSMFKKQTGKNFTDFVAEMKIAKAREMIATHQYMMYEISDMLGFDTQYYFSTVFKKLTGVSPKEYEAQTLLHREQ